MGGNETDFRELYDAYFANVWAYAVSRAGRQAAEDIVGETFAVAWRRRDALPPDPLPWLLGVARNVLRESYRADRRRELLAAELQTWTSGTSSRGDDIADDVTDRTRALTALAALPQRDQELLLLVAWHGLSASQAAHTLQCSRATFFVRLHRARHRLERALQNDDDPGVAETMPVVFDKEISR